MKTHGTKLLDPLAETSQLEWMLLPVQECPDAESERRIIQAHFRVPHEPWGPGRAFVLPVQVRRGRNWVLFRQISGVAE